MPSQRTRPKPRGIGFTAADYLQGVGWLTAASLTRADNEAQDHRRESNMIASDKRKSQIAALVFIVSAGAAMALISNSHQNLWEMGVLGPALGITMMFSYLYALICYVSAKGRHGGWVVFALLFSVVGLLIVLSLEDHCKDGTLRPPPQKLRSGWAGDS